MSDRFWRLCDPAHRQHEVVAIRQLARLGMTRSEIVEVDGFEHHRERPQFDGDRHRGLVHRASGYEVVRISADHVHDEPALALRALAYTLGGPGSRSSRLSKPGRDSPPNLSASSARTTNGPNT